jgi:hypothetical protein
LTRLVTDAPIIRRLLTLAPYLFLKADNIASARLGLPTFITKLRAGEPAGMFKSIASSHLHPIWFNGSAESPVSGTKYDLKVNSDKI